MKNLSDYISKNRLIDDVIDDTLALKEYSRLDKAIKKYVRKNIRGTVALVFESDDIKDRFTSFGMLFKDNKNANYLVDKNLYDKANEYLNDVTNIDLLDEQEHLNSNFPIKGCTAFGPYIKFEFRNNMKDEKLNSYAILTGI